MAASLFIVLITVLYHQSAFADPSLPLVEDRGVYSIDVLPSKHQLIVRKHGKLVKVYPVAVGNPSTPTPVGEYKVIYKGKDWGPSFGPRWLGLNVPWGIYGIHGTNKPYSIGQHESHGCIRMHNKHVTELFDMIPLGTKVTIYGHVLGPPSRNPRDLAEGDVGGDVQLIQNRLKSAGYYNGVCDGKFRSSTTAALKKFQRDRRLTPNGVVSMKVYEELGLVE
ncbi:L,D-transpeptidase family protein [Brevibacillus choshinensis]|uniref:L,D-transpeptidase family protein n=1 Tax=Brevibacillus choshinensis TaxID=54911 RepID=A0ABX7FY63_BRECH|nr:L,D-transpeptidase family protein [Brevibacillus choshinensis]QRG70754.1 L,D-transpeptidase family protein [Brevibacillus choshinensis]